MAMVSLIIVNYNGKKLTTQCVQSIRRIPCHVPMEIIIVDNASTDGSVDELRRLFPDVIILEQRSNGGFGKANNAGVRVSHGDFLFFINNDIEFQMDNVAPLMKFLQSHPSAGAAAPMLLNPDGSYQHSFGKFPSLLNEMRTKRDTAALKERPAGRLPRKVDWVSFAAVMIRREVFQMINGFDERYFMYFEDSDFCCRLNNAGFDSYYCAEASVIHFGGKSWSDSNALFLKQEYRKSQLLFYSLHRSRINVLFLRFYLLARFSMGFLFGPAAAREQARSLMNIALTSIKHS